MNEISSPSIDNGDGHSSKFVSLRVEVYRALVNSIVLVSVLLSISIAYIIWLHCFRRRSTKQVAGVDVERVPGKINESPGTLVNSAPSLTNSDPLENSIKSVHLKTDRAWNNNEYQISPSNTPSTTASFSPVFPTSQTRMPERETAPSTPGMSVGDRLRTQKMIRDITRISSTSADSASLEPVAATLGLGLQQEGHRSRSSLYTIAETVHERSTLNSPEPISTPSSATKFTHDA
ncbi:hypothetical protein FRC17_001089 [Serendipita sp. 399]|nr:hypothetical protein FRC17_001089 [Serendipita sp. 399]